MPLVSDICLQSLMSEEDCYTDDDDCKDEDDDDGDCDEDDKDDDDNGVEARTT